MTEWRHLASHRRLLLHVPISMKHAHCKLANSASSSRNAASFREKLEELDIPFEHPVAKTGIVATIGNNKSPKFALRSDIDALPILVSPPRSFRGLSTPHA